ncbi:DUF4157 domain-containing protein [Paraliomyxa miuraensis]|nr:DUF4157 domain-containing protein [Paraliomyxa miuraensis]
MLAGVARWAEGGIKASRLAEGRVRLPGPGRALDDDLAEQMGRFLGADFSRVRIYEDAVASALGAAAFTMGDAICFAPGAYAPRTSAGIELIAHELTHVVQQREDRVSNPFGSGVAVVQDPRLESEAERLARSVQSIPSWEPRRWASMQLMKRPGFTTDAKKSAYHYHNASNRGFQVDPNRPRLRSFNAAMPHRMSWADIRRNIEAFWNDEDSVDDFKRWTKRFVKAGRDRIAEIRGMRDRYRKQGRKRDAWEADEALRRAEASQEAFEDARDDFARHPYAQKCKREFARQANSFHANVPDLGPHDGVNNPVRERTHLHFRRRKNSNRRSPSPMSRRMLRMSPERISEIATTDDGDIIDVHGEVVDLEDLSRKRKRQVENIGFHTIKTFDPDAQFGKKTKKKRRVS